MIRIRGTAYPVLLPAVRDPRLHLAAVIISLQVLGQTSFDFNLSIAQILVSVLTCAVLEVAITFRTQRVLMWPASALLTGNGVAFILRVPGTEHGDWWSMNGWWIFAGTAAISLLSKYVIKFRGSHVFNPSNFGLVLCFLLLGPEHADPLDFWWGPMSVALAFALVIITVGGLSILSRLKLLEIAVGFWLAFAAGLAVLAASGHEMTARWHLGPITGWEFWRVLVFSPEILVFLFFMITDPRTIPRTGAGRRAYAIGIGLLAVMLIAPQTTEFATKLAVLAALFIACAIRPVLVCLQVPLRFGGGRARLGTYRGRGCRRIRRARRARGHPRPPRRGVRERGCRPARSPTSPSCPRRASRRSSTAAARSRSHATSSRTSATRRTPCCCRDPDRATAGAAGERLASVWARIDAAGADGRRPRVRPRAHDGQAGARRGAGAAARRRRPRGDGRARHLPRLAADRAGAGRRPTPYRQTLELVLSDGRYLIVGSRGPTPRALAAPAAVPAPAPATGLRLEDVAAESGLRFRHGAFRFKNSNDPVASMGGGLCWLDYDDDGWLDLFVVNSYSIESDLTQWKRRGGTPRTALFRNERGRFVDVSRGSGANVSLRGNGCVAGDLNGDGRTDLYVTADRLRRAALEPRRRDVRRGRPRGGDHDLRLAQRRRGRRREPRRPARSLRVELRRPEQPGAGRSGRLPEQLLARSRPPLPQPRPGREGALALPRGRASRQASRRSRSTTASVSFSPTTTATDGSTSTSRTTPTRTVCSRTSPPPARSGSGWWSDRATASSRPPGGHGRRVRGLQPRPAARPVRDELAPAAARRFRQSRARVRGCAADLRAGVRHALRRLGRRVVRPRPRRRPRRRPRERGDPGAEPRSRRRARSGAREPRGREIVDVSEGVLGAAGLRVNGRGLAAADYDNDGDVDVAINSIAGPLALLRNAGAPRALARGRVRAFSPGARVTVELPDGQRLVREVQAGSSYLSSEDPRVHFGLGRPRG